MYHGYANKDNAVNYIHAHGLYKKERGGENGSDLQTSASGLHIYSQPFSN